MVILSTVFGRELLPLVVNEAVRFSAEIYAENVTASSESKSFFM